MSSPDWSPEEIETLQSGWASGLTASEIAARLPGRSRNSVLGYVDRHRDVFGKRCAEIDRANLAKRTRQAMVREKTEISEVPPRPKMKPVVALAHRAKASTRIASPAPMVMARTLDAKPVSESLPHGWKRDGRADRSLAGFAVPGVEPVPFKALDHRQCHFMLAGFWADDCGETPCCGAPAQPGKSWCADHMRLVWSKRRARLAVEADKVRPVRAWA